MHSWAIRVAVLPDELFSTWLARAALAQGCDPMYLTGWLWPRWRAWTVDLDRGLSPDRLATLAARSGLTAARLEAATLRPLLTAVAPGTRPQQAVWPWVLSQGSRNRRRYGGLQCCPSCLSEDQTPYFRRTWRLAWHIGCTRHGTLLADHCGRCQAPVEPHRVRAGDGTLCRCPSCGHDLRGTNTATACTDALAFQVAADEVLVTGQGIWSTAKVDCETWFGLAAKHAGGRIRGQREDATLVCLTKLSLNLQRPSERVLRLRMAYRDMSGEPRGEMLHGQRRTIASCGAVVPDFGLQHGQQRQFARARPQATVQGEWVRLLRRMRVGHP